MSHCLCCERIWMGGWETYPFAVDSEDPGGEDANGEEVGVCFLRAYGFGEVPFWGRWVWWVGEWVGGWRRRRRFE